MANYCDFTCYISTQNAQLLHQKLERCLEEAEAKHEGMFIGSERYLFDCQLEVEENQISLFGYTKWCFASDEMEKFIKFVLNLDSSIESIYVEYEEGGCLLFGKYRYENDVITHTYLNDRYYPNYDNEDSYYELLNENLTKHGIEESWVLT